MGKTPRVENLREVSPRCCFSISMRCLPILHCVHQGGFQKPSKQQQRGGYRAEILLVLGQLLGPRRQRSVFKGHQGEVALINTPDRQLRTQRGPVLGISNMRSAFPKSKINTPSVTVTSCTLSACQRKT